MSIAHFGIYPAQDRLFGDFLCGLWVTACAALAMPAEQASRITQQLRSLLPAWADEPIGTAPRQLSFVAADGFPAEMSVNWSAAHPELRMLFDCSSDMHEEYDLVRAARPGSSVPYPAAASRRFRQVSEVFTPRAGRPSTAPLWHSLAWRPPGLPVHKAYFGLYAWPQPQRYAAVGAAMERLGMTAAWEDSCRRVENGGQSGQREIEFLGLDLADTADARVKIYYRNHGADIHELNRMGAVALTHDSQAALAAYQTLAAGRADAGEEALTCLAFRSGLDRAAESTTYLRMTNLTSSDQEAVDRTAALLRREGLESGPLQALAAALAPGRLHDTQGILELVSHRTARRTGDVTTYFRFSVYGQAAPLPASPTDRTRTSHRKDSALNSDLKRIADYNQQRFAEYESSNLIQLLADANTPEDTKHALLTYLQPWSNSFQRMISARVVYETDPDLRILALEHQKEEIGHDALLARSRANGDRPVVWDPIIEAGASWFVDQFATLPGIQRAVLAHLALEAGALALCKAGSLAFPDHPYFGLHVEADAEHLDMGYRLLQQRADWTTEDMLTVLDRAWQIIAVVSDRIAQCAQQDTQTTAAA